MARVDRGSITVTAGPATVYGALVEAERLLAWLPPDGMRGRIERFDPRPGGGYRLVLTYLDPAGSPGKTTADEDVVDVRFAALEPGRLVVQQVDFDTGEAADADTEQAYAGTMTMTWRLTADRGGTLVEVTAADVPSGIDPDVHEAGIASSLAHLKAYVERG